jgi:hypothetical protein
VRGPSAFDPFEAHVRQLLAEFPAMPASVVAERVAPWLSQRSQEAAMRERSRGDSKHGVRARDHPSM